VLNGRLVRQFDELPDQLLAPQPRVADLLRVQVDADDLLDVLFNQAGLFEPLRARAAS